MKQISFILFFLIQISIFAQMPTSLPQVRQRQSLSLAHYLKSKYFGTTISYTNVSIEKKKRRFFKKKKKSGTVTAEKIEGVPVELVLRQDGYYFVLEDGNRVKVDFTSVERGGQDLQRRFSKDKMELQMQVIKTQEFINASLQSMGSGTNAAMKSSFSDPSKFNGYSPGQDDFAYTEEILYTDLKSKQIKKDMAMADMNGIYLKSGAHVSIRFLRVKNDR